MLYLAKGARQGSRGLLAVYHIARHVMLSIYQAGLTHLGCISRAENGAPAVH